MRSFRGIVFPVAILLFVVLTPSAHAILEYKLYDIGTLGGDTYAYGLNDLGQVVGSSQTSPGGTSVAVLWQMGGSLTQLQNPAGYTANAWASDLNNSGRIIGQATRTSTVWDEAFRWESFSDAPISLGNFGHAMNRAFGINANGDVTGGASKSGTAGPPIADTDVYLWSGADPLQNLGGFGSTAEYGAGINLAGQISGHYQNGSTWRGFYINGGSAYDIGHPAGLSPSVYVVLRGINETGQAVGYARTGTSSSAPYYAFIYDPVLGFIEPNLGTLGGAWSYGFAINDALQVAGSSPTAAGETHAHIWEPGATPGTGTMYDLNGYLVNPIEGWVLDTAYDINEAGEIAGIMKNTTTGETRGFFLAVIPEPSVMAMLGLGITGILRGRRRR